MKRHLFLVLFLIFCIGATAGGKKDTVRVAGTDSMYVREFDKKGNLKGADVYFKGEIVATRIYYRTDSTYGFSEDHPDHDTANIREFYLNGKPRIVGTQLKMKQLTGPYLTYYSNGNSQCVCYYTNGKREGLQKIYHENGQLEYDVNYHNGEMQGHAVQYYDNGQVRREGNFVNGFETDTFSYYYPDGSLWTKVVFRKGVAYDVIVNNAPDGKPQDKGTLKNGTGTRYVYDEKGKLVAIEEFKNGKQMRTRKVK